MNYIAKDQLAHAGFATPEAALQSMLWAGAFGTYDQANEVLDPTLLAEELKRPERRDQFAANQAASASYIKAFKGAQILAKKVLTANRVELKVRIDCDHLPPRYVVYPMAFIGDAWKLGGSSTDYSSRWDIGGEIQTFAP